MSLEIIHADGQRTSVCFPITDLPQNASTFCGFSVFSPQGPNLFVNTAKLAAEHLPAKTLLSPLIAGKKGHAVFGEHLEQPHSI